MKDLRAGRARRADDGARADLAPLAATFLRGLSLGALVGAAIAGSAIFRRLRDARADAAHGDDGMGATPPEDPA